MAHRVSILPDFRHCSLIPIVQVEKISKILRCPRAKPMRHPIVDGLLEILFRHFSLIAGIDIEVLFV